MRLQKNSRASDFLFVLINYGQMNYAQIKLCWKNFETTKDAAQKLVKAGFIERKSFNNDIAFYPTEEGVKEFNKSFNTNYKYVKPTLSLKELDVCSRRNFEKRIFLDFKSNIDKKITTRNGSIFISDFKKELFNNSKTGLQQIQGSIASFVFYKYEKGQSEALRVTIYFFYFLYDSNKILNDTTENNLLSLIKERALEATKEYGIEKYELIIKTVFIVNDSNIIIDILGNDVKTKKIREYAVKKKGYIRTRGRLVGESFNCNTEYNKYFAVINNRPFSLIDTLVNLVCDTYSNQVLSENLKFGCSNVFNLCDLSYHNYLFMYKMFQDTEAIPFDDYRINYFLNENQLPFIKNLIDAYCQDNYKLFKVNDREVNVYLNKNEVFIKRTMEVFMINLKYAY